MKAKCIMNKEKAKEFILIHMEISIVGNERMIDLMECIVHTFLYKNFKGILLIFEWRKI